MRSLAKTLESEVAAWPLVTVAPHQFAAREFRFRNAEIGHVHFWGDVDIPFPPAVHDLLLAEGRAQRHRWLPDSGWVTYHIHNRGDLEQAIWLLRLSYVRYALKDASDPEKNASGRDRAFKTAPATRGPHGEISSASAGDAEKCNQRGMTLESASAQDVSFGN